MAERARDATRRPRGVFCSCRAARRTRRCPIPERTGHSIEVEIEDVTDSARVDDAPSLVVEVSFGPASRRTA
jgi:hypothetical protein